MCFPLSQPIEHMEFNHDASLLQTKLNELNKWSGQWQLKISQKKCAFMNVYGNDSKPGLRLGYSNIYQVNCFEDLGVFIDDNLSFNTHINYIVSKAFTRPISNLIYKCFISRDV
jgi:hypothetical protein